MTDKQGHPRSHEVTHVLSEVQKRLQCKECYFCSRMGHEIFSLSFDTSSGLDPGETSTAEISLLVRSSHHIHILGPRANKACVRTSRWISKRILHKRSTRYISKTLQKHPGVLLNTDFKKYISMLSNEISKGLFFKLMIWLNANRLSQISLQ